MKIHEATEQAYKNGYAKGYADATDNNVGCKWISVTERLPDKPGRYIICEELGRVMIAGWDTSCWFGGHSYSEFTVYKATHWMPLPSAEGLV